MLKQTISWILLAGMAVYFPKITSAAVFVLADDQESLMGEIKITHSMYEDTLLSIAEKYGLGYREIRLSNPGVDPLLPGEGREIVLPTQFLLPHAPRQGIVLNIPELRLYYYPSRIPGTPQKVITYPIGIGKEGWNTPYVKTRIASKQKDPAWYPPESIREEHAAEGDFLPKRVEPGPDNPLGKFAMKLGLGAYAIHGTNSHGGVGMRASHGCIRLYPDDIQALYQLVELGTPVNIINQPYKVALHEGKIYLEAHPYLEEDEALFKDNVTSVVRLLIDMTEGSDYEVNWNLAKRVVHEMQGVPVVIGRIDRVSHPPADRSASDANGLKLQLDTRLGKTGK